ncbi:MAG: hypothetical protein GY718_10135 [Lentisphaerae bacterium]|nr:hypothetical protein [Lentisphaerota bacterium]
MNLDEIIIYLERCLKTGTCIDTETGKVSVAMNQETMQKMIGSLKEINDLLDRNRMNLVQ